MSEARPIDARRRLIICARCGAAADSGARFCQACGQAFPRAGEPACPHCGSPYWPGAAYCETCSAALPATPHLIITTTGIRLALFTAGQSAVTLGRADALSGVAPDLDLETYGGALSGLSRRHARITRRDNQCWIEDLNSVNLTYLNQQRLTPEQLTPLKDGDVIRLGNLLVTFRSK